METKRKIQYEAPTTLVVEVKTEGLICLSDPVNDAPGDRSGYPGLEL